MRIIVIFHAPIFVQFKERIARRRFLVETGARRFRIALAPPKTTHRAIAAILNAVVNTMVRKVVVATQANPHLILVLVE